jgi:hypothetical protein
MIPIRASIVGPPFVATRIKACIAACHSVASCSAFGAGILESDELATVGQRDWFVERPLPTAVRHAPADHAPSPGRRCRSF